MPMIFSISIIVISLLTLLSLVLLYRFVSTNASVDMLESTEDDVGQTDGMLEAEDEIRRLKIQIVKGHRSVNTVQIRRFRGRAVVLSQARSYRRSNKKNNTTRKNARFI